MDERETLFATAAATHRGLLLNVAANVVGRGEAEDVVQQSLLKAWRALGQWHGGGEDGMRSWLCRVTKTVALDWRAHARFFEWRYTGVRPELVDDLGAWFVEHETPEDAYLRRERQEDAHRQVAEGLARCTPPQRQALWSIGQELRREEAAQAFGVRNGAVKTDRFRGMRAFQGLNVMTGKPRKHPPPGRPSTRAPADSARSAADRAPSA